jgi:dTMP kinase
MKNKKKLIIVEGVDGSGKSTIALELTKIVQKKGFTSLYLKEPLDEYKKMLSTTYDSVEQLMLMWLSRRKLFKFIKENLKKTDYIFLDRSFISTIIYQQKAVKELFKNIKEFLQKDKAVRYNIDPDLIVFLKIKKISTIKERFRKDNRILDVFEDERNLTNNIIKYQKIVPILKSVYGKKVLVINAEKDKKQVLDEILNYLAS